MELKKRSLKTDEQDEAETYNKVISYLESHHYIPFLDECVLRNYSEEQERESIEHLVALGFARKIVDL